MKENCAPNDHPESNSKETHHSSGGYIWQTAIVLSFAIIAFLLVTVTWVGGDSRGESQIRIGVYKAFSLSPYYARQAAKADLQVIDQFIVDDKKFDVMILPLSAVIKHGLELKDWRIVWVSEHSGTHLLRGHENPIGKSSLMQSVGDTFGGYLIQKFIKHGCASGEFRPAEGMDCYQSQLRFKRELNSGADLRVYFKSAELVAVHEPFAKELVEHHNFKDISEINDPADVNVLLARPKLLPFSVDTPLLNFILQLREIRDEHLNDAGRDLVGVRQKLKDLVGDATIKDEELQELLIQYKPASIKDNLHFLYDFGANGCTSAVATLIEPETPDSICNMIDPLFVDFIFSRIKGSRPEMALDHSELQDLCLSRRRILPMEGDSVFAGFDPGFSQVTPQMKKQLKSLKFKLNGKHVYCFIGHGDAEGREEYNDRLGQQRADALALAAKNVLNIQQSNFITVSVGKRNAYAKGPQFRRVEIKRIDIQMDILSRVVPADLE